MRLGDDIAPSAKNDVSIQRIGRHITVLDHAHRMPFSKCDDTVVAAIRDANRTALLLPGTQSIRVRRRHTDVIQLRSGLVVPGAPRLATIDRDETALIADQRDVPRIIGTDPDGLIVITAG